MASGIDDTIAMQFKPAETGADPVKIMNAIAQMNLARAHEQLYGAESQYKLGLMPAMIDHLRAQSEQARSTARYNEQFTPAPYDNDPSTALSSSLSSSGGTVDNSNRGAYLSHLGDLEKKYGLPTGYLSKTAQIESGFDNNSVSSAGARGVFQFMPATARQYGVNPNDPLSSAEGAARLARDNRSALQTALGRDPTAQELYLAHNQGARGALGAITNPMARAVDTLGDLAVTQNGGHRGMTNAQFAQFHARRFDAANVPSVGATDYNKADPDEFHGLPKDVDKRVLSRYPQFADKIIAIDEGRMKPSSLNAKEKSLVMNAVNQYDKNFDETVWTERNRFRSDWGGGKILTLKLATDQLLQHINTADADMVALHNSNYPLANSIKNWWATATGDPRVDKFNSVREVASLDAARLLRGSGAMAEKDIEFWRNTLSSAKSPKQLHEQFAQLADDLISARVGSIEHAYRTTLGREPPQMISPASRAALEQIKRREPLEVTVHPSSAGGSPAPGAPSGLPAGVPSGSMWSPSRRQFRSPDGKLFDADGKAL